MLERIKLVWTDWRDNFLLGFQKGQFPGEMTAWIVCFIIWIDWDKLSLMENVLIFAFSLFIMVSWQFHNMFPNRLHPLYYLMPMSRKEMQRFLWTSYWMKFVILEAMCILWMIPMFICGRITILGAFLWISHFAFLQISKGLVRDTPYNEKAFISHGAMEISYIISGVFAEVILQKGVNSATVGNGIMLGFVIVEILLCIRIFCVEVPKNFNWACSYEALSEQMDVYAKEDGKAGRR